MKHYRVLLNGENFLINMEGKESYMGFYTTRFVSAISPEEAELNAVNSIKTDDRIKGIILNSTEHEQPMIYMDEIEEIQKNEKEDNYGFGWYDMDSSND